MWYSRLSSQNLRLALGGLLLSASGAGAENLPEFDKLPANAELPNPLVGFDGVPIASREAWEIKRKPELKTLFQQYMYGYFPAAPTITSNESSVDKQCFGGKATRKEITLEIEPAGCPPIHLLVFVPNERPADKPAPVFVTLNFKGNHSLLDDPAIELPSGWMPEGPGVEQHRATDAGRGKDAAAWPIEQIIDRGYAIATLYYGDVMPDKPDFGDGIYPYFRAEASGEEGAPERTPTEWGCIACWAWGLQRAVDYVVTDPQLDARRIVAFGHSRNGKAALLAAAFDDRIAAVIPHQAGCGGTAPSRRKNPNGESVTVINDHFPHWFSKTFRQFGGHEDRLPFDQHCLIALCAPRAVLLTNGDQDQWADPPGQFQMLLAARPVYRLYGREGLADGISPPVDRKTVGAELSYYIRNSPHLVDAEYWNTFLDFADRVLKPAAQ
jgi:hypothetical protein